MSAPDVKAPGPAGEIAGRAHGEANTDIVDQQSNERQDFEKAQAKAALLGCTLHQLSSGGYLLGRWTMCRELPDLRAVLTLLAQIGGR